MVKRCPPAGVVLAAATVALIGGAAAPANAHPEISPVATNRYVLLTALDRSLEITYALLAGQLPGAELRRRIDSNGDRVITPAEIDRERRRFGSEASALLAVSLDGVAVNPVWEASVDLGGDLATGAAPVVMELRASCALSTGRPHTVRVEPGREPPRLGETEISIDVAPGLRLEAGYQGAGQGLRGNRFKLDGPRVSDLEDRSVTFTFASDPRAAAAALAARPLDRAPRSAGILIVAGLALGFAHALGRRSEGRATRAAVQALGHGFFPAATGVLLAFARARALGPDGAALALRWAAAAAAGLLALAPAFTASRDLDAVTGHAESPLAGLAVPSLTMIAIAICGAMQQPALAAAAPAAFAAGAAGAPSVPTAPWRSLRYLGASALVAAVLTA